MTTALATAPAATETAIVTPTAQAAFERKRLLATLRVACRVAPNRSPRPLLECVRIEFDGNTATVHATDLETHYRACVPCDGDRFGEAQVNAKALRDALNTCPDEDVVLRIVGDALHVVGRSSVSPLPQVTKGEFPTMPEGDAVGSFAIEGATLAAALKYLIPATDSENSRYALGGILFDLAKANDQIGDAGTVAHLVATDGRRLHHVESPLTYPGDAAAFPEPGRTGDPTVIVPCHAAKAIAAAFSRDLRSVAVSRFLAEGCDWLRFDIGGAVFTCRTLAGPLPPVAGM